MVFPSDIMLLQGKRLLATARSLAPRRAGRRGFSLIELAIVVTLLGILLILAVPAFMRITERSENTRFIHDLRIFTQAFETYSLAMGEWPPDSAPSVLPPGLDADLHYFPWDEINTVNGRWKWDAGTGGALVGIATVGTDQDLNQLLWIDQQIDDGNLATGSFRERAGGGYVYLLVTP